MAKKVDYSAVELKETLIDTKTRFKTVKGGRIARFSALVVVGDGAGHVGYGLGKAAEVPEAIRKAIEAAKRERHRGFREGGRRSPTRSSASSVRAACLKPASPGTGIIAGGTMRAILESARYPRHPGKSLRSNNAINVVKRSRRCVRFARPNRSRRCAASAWKPSTAEEVCVKMAKVKLTLAKSLIGRKKTRSSANSLGLKKNWRYGCLGAGQHT